MSNLLPIELQETQLEWLWDMSWFSLNSPSVRSGMTWPEEVYERAMGVHILNEIGVHFLKLSVLSLLYQGVLLMEMLRTSRPQLSMASAAVYLHRFYAFHSLQEYPARVRSAALGLDIRLTYIHCQGNGSYSFVSSLQSRR